MLHSEFLINKQKSVDRRIDVVGPPQYDSMEISADNSEFCIIKQTVKPFAISMDRLQQQWDQEQQDIQQSFKQERLDLEQEYKASIEDINHRERDKLITHQRSLENMIECLLAKRQQELHPVGVKSSATVGFWQWLGV